MKTGKITKEYFSSIILEAAIFFMLCIYEPITLFFSNQKDYPCDFYEIFPECLKMFFVFTVGTAAVLFVCNLFAKKIYHYVLCLLLWFYLCLYIQGNYMVSDLPVLDGRYIEWSDYSGQTVFSTCFWVVMLVLCILGAVKIKREKFTEIAKYVGIFISLMLLITGITVGITKDGFKRRLELASTSKNILEYSEDTNFILLVMDSMDAEEESIILEKYPEYKEAFSDFTYYDNVLGGYLETVFAVPHLYGGERYTSDTSFLDYVDYIFLESEFVKRLDKEKFRLQAYTEEVPLNTPKITKYENVIDYKATVTDHISFCKVLLRMTGYKYAPYCLKKYTQVLPGELNGHLRKPEEVRVWNFSWSNVPFYEECLNSKFELSDKKCFKLIHLAAAHYPFEYTKDVELVTYSSYEDNMAASNTILATYLEKLKQEGVYDNTIIFIAADHGISEDDDIYKRMNPVLFVKGIDEHHDKMQINSAPITQGDYKDAYIRLLDGAKSDQIFDWKDDDQRDRFILFGNGLGQDLIEYIQTGYAWDVSTLSKTGVVYRAK